MSSEIILLQPNELTTLIQVLCFLASNNITSLLDIFYFNGSYKFSIISGRLKSFTLKLNVSNE